MGEEDEPEAFLPALSLLQVAGTPDGGERGVGMHYTTKVASVAASPKSVGGTKRAVTGRRAGRRDTHTALSHTRNRRMT